MKFKINPEKTKIKNQVLQLQKKKIKNQKKMMKSF